MQRMPEGERESRVLFGTAKMKMLDEVAKGGTELPGVLLENRKIGGADKNSVTILGCSAG